MQSNLMESFGETLYILRKEKKLSQESLGIQAELDRSTIYNWETQKFPNRNPTMIAFFKLCAGLEIEPEAFIIRMKEVHGQRYGH